MDEEPSELQFHNKSATMGRTCLIEEDHVTSYVNGLIQKRVVAEVLLLPIIAVPCDGLEKTPNVLTQRPDQNTPPSRLSRPYSEGRC